jgi:hypothetical protein
MMPPQLVVEEDALLEYATPTGLVRPGPARPDRPVGAPAWTKVHYARVFAFNRVEPD